MNELRAAVVGAGRLGALHARKYAALAGVRLTHVVDIDARARTRNRASAMAPRRSPTIASSRARSTSASVAAPGSLHHAIASDLLAPGIDVLVEKPMAATSHEARELAALAERSGRILQVGHLERFNPAIVELRPIVRAPRFIECHRLAPFTERGTDVDVILDLMVHDLDVILSLTTAEVAAVEAIGVAVLTDQIDVANARLRFQRRAHRQPQHQPRRAAPRAQNPLLPARRLHLGRLRSAPHPGLPQDSAAARRHLSGNLRRADRSRRRRSAGRRNRRVRRLRAHAPRAGGHRRSTACA